MLTETLITVGYFSYDCQDDGYCTYGCGKRPKTVCYNCQQEWCLLEGKAVPDNFHPLHNNEDNTIVDVCDLCNDYFGEAF